MSYWNYRVVRHKETQKYNKKSYATYWYAVHEAYYDDNGFVGAITKDPTEPFGEMVSECKESYEMMAEAFKAPILDYDQIPEPGYTKDADPIERGIKEVNAGKTTPHDKVVKTLREKYGVPKFNFDKSMKEAEAERVKDEKKYVKGLKKKKS